MYGYGSSMWICEGCSWVVGSCEAGWWVAGSILVAPVAVDTDAAPAGGGIVEDESEAGTAGAAADHIEIDDGVLAVVGELREGEAKDGLRLRGELLPFFKDSFGFGFVHCGVGEGEDRIGFCRRDAGGMAQPGLLPAIGIIAGEVDLFGELVERSDGNGFLQVVFDPFVIVIFHEAAGVCVDNQIIAGEGAVYDGVEDIIDKSFGGWRGYGIGVGGGE